MASANGIVFPFHPASMTRITIAADPVGTSAGNVMRSSRLAEMSALRLTVFAICATPFTPPKQMRVYDDLFSTPKTPTLGERQTRRVSEGR
jgi:hypothetical protein